MEDSTDKPRAQLDRSAWVNAATEILAENGLPGLRVELLAKRLKVTKGSFYWHFKDRSDLLQSVLLAWKEGRIRDIVKQTQCAPGDERAQIYRLMELYRASRSRRGMLIELAVRDWAQRDPVPAAVVGEVDDCRLQCARQLFLACGMSVQEATSRSLLLYAYVFGSSLMIYENIQDLPRLRQEIADLVAGARVNGRRRVRARLGAPS